MKSFLVTTSAPFCGTDQHYGAYAENEEDVLNFLYIDWYDEEVQHLWDNYSYLAHYEDEWEDMSDEERAEYEDYGQFLDAKYEEWSCDCELSVEECTEEDFKDYVPGGDGELEIVYDCRQH